MRMLRLRPVAAALLAVHVQACVTWQPAPGSPRQLLEGEPPSRVRVTTVDGVTVVVAQPAIANDSIVGTTRDCRDITTPEGHRICAPITTVSSIASLDDVVLLEVTKASAKRTLTGVLLVPVVAFGLLLVVACAGEDSYVCE